MLHIAFLSGGRDSTAMTLIMLEKGMKLDHIIFSDTGLEHKEMYEYLDKLDSFFKRKYGISITRLYPAKNFDEYIWEKRKKGEQQTFSFLEEQVRDCFCKI